MTQIELIDRLCAANEILTEIVREQAAIMAQHGIEEIQQEGREGLSDRIQRAENENDAIEYELRRHH